MGNQSALMTQRVDQSGVGWVGGVGGALLDFKVAALSLLMLSLWPLLSAHQPEFCSPSLIQCAGLASR